MIVREAHLIGGFFRFYKINLFEYQLIKNNFVYINIFVYFCKQQTIRNYDNTKYKHKRI